MEIRAIRYFLAIAKEESISRAAEYLNITQPTLSRQMKDLEEELNVQLFVRGNRCITLTSEGMLLRKRAEEIVSLLDKAKEELVLSNENIRGDIYIGYAETNGFQLIAKTSKKLQLDHPNISFHMYHGYANGVIERLDKGLLDFGILNEPIDLKKYDFIPLPLTDQWGIIMRKDSLLAQKASVTPEDLMQLPIISSRVPHIQDEIEGWLGKSLDQLNIISTYNLMYDAFNMVNEGIGYALCLDKLTENNQLCFRPFQPKLEVNLAFAWKKHQILSSASKEYIKRLQSCILSLEETVK